MGRNDVNKISKILGKLPSMHARLQWLHAHMYIPDGYKLNLIPVDSGCTVSNINDGSIVHAEHRMSASRPIQVASKDVDPITQIMRVMGLYLHIILSAISPGFNA